MKRSGKYKILLVGDASNYNRCLAEGLRRLGHEVTVASNGSRWMNTGRDVDLSRPVGGKLGGLLLWLKIKRLLRTRLAGYDIVSITGVCCLSLKPGRIAAFLDQLKARNRHVFNTSLGTDSNYVEACLDPTFLRYSEWLVGDKPAPMFAADPGAAEAWLTPSLRALTNKVYFETEGTATALYEYHRASQRLLPDERLGYVGIPVDTSAIEYKPLVINGKVKIFLGRHSYRQLEKGTDRLYEAARRVVDAHPDCAELILVENLPYNQYISRLRESHIVLDQLYSYTPATNALLAMAMGKVVVSGAEPEYYDFIGERELHPIVNANPFDDNELYRQLEQLVLHPDQLPALAEQGRRFVEKHNDVEVVAQRFLRLWESQIFDSQCVKASAVADLKLDLLIATHGADGLQRVAGMDLPRVDGVRYIVTWQQPAADCNPAQLTTALFPDRQDVEVHTTRSTGLSRNRNLGIALATAPLCLIADNDLHYTPAQLQSVIDTFARHPEVDLATFRMAGTLKRYYPEECDISRKMPKNHYVSSVEIAFRRQSLGDIRFNERFGLGADYGLGEEEIFLADCRRAGLNCRYFPITITTHPGDTTGLRPLTAATAFGSGAVVRYVNGFWRGLPRAFLIIVRRRRAGLLTRPSLAFRILRGFLAKPR